MERRLIAEVTILEQWALKEAVLVRQAEHEEGILALRRGVAEGQLVERAEFHDYVNNLCVSIRTKLLAIPSSVALDLSGKSNPRDCERVLRHAIENALTELDTDLNDAAWLQALSAWGNMSMKRDFIDMFWACVDPIDPPASRTCVPEHPYSFFTKLADMNSRVPRHFMSNLRRENRHFPWMGWAVVALDAWVGGEPSLVSPQPRFIQFVHFGVDAARDVPHGSWLKFAEAFGSLPFHDSLLIKMF
jgi:hypothetical protein